ncbi:MAG TPA: hypothetical protein VM939_10420 [Gemmatimonadaceae bacterium]|nr:hypothetical protein [Gemmatimonadaceae bacterium]
MGNLGKDIQRIIAGSAIDNEVLPVDIVLAEHGFDARPDILF